MTSGDLDRAMIQIQLWWFWEIQIEWWSRSSGDDLDRVMIQIQSSDIDPDREMIQIQWWCSMMIHIERWSRFSDDVPWWSRSRDDPDSKNEDDLNTKMTWRLKRLEMQMTRWSSWYREEDQCWKLCRKNTFLVKRECWCICNFGMYSSMYLIYCKPDVYSGMSLLCIWVMWSCPDVPIGRINNVIKSYQFIR